MADVKWIKIVVDIFDDEKIKLIETLPEADTIIVIWFKLLCMAGKQNNCGVFVMNNKIAYTDEMLSVIFARPQNTVKLALNAFEQYGMIEIHNGVITIPKWEEHQSIDMLEKMNEQAKVRMRKYREKQKLLTDESQCNVTVTSRYDTDKIRLEYKEHIVHFDTLWKLYPNKKGKGQVSDSQKKKLCKITFDEMQRALNRYLADLKKDDWRKLQNGSTFFNSGYVDYLDSNYTTENKKIFGGIKEL